MSEARLFRSVPLGSMIALVLLSSTIALSSVSCSGDTAGAENLPLRIGYGPWPGFDVVVYAEAAGLFRERGVEVELVRLDNQFDATRALRRGKLDAAFTSLSDMMLLPPSQENPSLILVTNVSNGADGIVARPGIDSIDELRGQLVSAKLRTVNQIILFEALDAHGVRVDEVLVLDLTNSVAEKKFLEGDLDAATLWEPQLSSLAKAVGGKVIHRTSDLESMVIDGLFARESVIESRGESLERFALAWFDIMDALESTPPIVYRIVADRIGQDADEFASDYSGLLRGDRELNRKMFSEGQIDATVQRLQELLQSAGEGQVIAPTTRSDVIAPCLGTRPVR